MIEQCEETSSWLAGCAEYVSPAEESLLKLMTPDYSNDPKSLQKLETRISGNKDTKFRLRICINDCFYSRKHRGHEKQYAVSRRIFVRG